MRALERASDDDRYRGYTTIGPHRDDIELSLEGRDARRQASQGRTALLRPGPTPRRPRTGRAERSRVDPLLLLDDVFSELDPVRSNRLLGLLPAGSNPGDNGLALARGAHPGSGDRSHRSSCRDARRATRATERVLNALAGRLRRVDLRVIDDARQTWPTVVDPVIAEHCRVEMIKDGVLIVSVPSGAFAQQIACERSTILSGFSSLGKGAPTSLKTVLK